MPQEFQRFIAAWEVVVLWHREQHPNEQTDKSLTRALKTILPTLNLDVSPEWLAAATLLTRWKILKMSGARDTGQRVTIERATDWNAIVDGLYTVRCNILKGGKNPRNANDLMLAGEAAAAATILARRLLGR